MCWTPAGSEYYYPEVGPRFRGACLICALVEFPAGSSASLAFIVRLLAVPPQFYFLFPRPRVLTFSDNTRFTENSL